MHLNMKNMHFKNLEHSQTKHKIMFANFKTNKIMEKPRFIHFQMANYRNIFMEKRRTGENTDSILISLFLFL
jgi:hypothetical protein